MSSPTDNSDDPNSLARLIEAARQGCGESLGALFELCRPYLLFVANEEMRVDLQGKVGPSDLVQETFLTAQKIFPRFLGHTEGELVDWLRRVLLNTLAGVKRHYCGTGKRDVALELEVDDDDSFEVLANVVAADIPTPSAEAIAREDEEALLRALEQLPELQRQVICWRREHRSFQDIGQQLGRSEAAASKLYARAVKHLTKILGASDATS